MTDDASFRADLHCHSTCSDGSDSPLELLHLAKQTGLCGLSITDHDSMEAYTEELFTEAKQLNLQILTGIELSSEYNNTAVHILGYDFDTKDPSLILFVQEMQNRRKLRNRQILEKLSRHKIFITEEELQEIATQSGFNKTLGRPHIAALMMKKGAVLSIQEAFHRYLMEGGCCYVPGFKYSPQDAILAIQKAGGKAVLAHPHFIRKGKLLKFLLSLSFDGIECYYGTLHKKQEMPWVKIANEKGWIATGGSDYHGAFKPHISLGCSWVGIQAFTKLKS